MIATLYAQVSLTTILRLSCVRSLFPPYVLTLLPALRSIGITQFPHYYDWLSHPYTISKASRFGACTSDTCSSFVTVNSNKSYKDFPSCDINLYKLADAWDPGGWWLLDFASLTSSLILSATVCKVSTSTTTIISGLSRSPFGFGSNVSLPTLHYCRYLQ